MNIRVHDVTLRSGEESPGATMSASDRLQIAHELAAAGVDVIEAGFPASSPRIAASVAAIAEQIPDVSVAAFARLHPTDVDLAWASIRRAREPRLVTCIATSDAHMRIKLRTTREACSIRSIRSSGAAKPIHRTLRSSPRMPRAAIPSSSLLSQAT